MRTSNWNSNVIRPTAIGKKNPPSPRLWRIGWLFVVGETTSQRAAIIHTMVECAKRHGHNPDAWLTDMLERLPAMTIQDDLSVLLPANWQPLAAAATPTRETCPARDGEHRRKHTYLCMRPMLRPPAPPDAHPLSAHSHPGMAKGLEFLQPGRNKVWPICRTKGPASCESGAPAWPGFQP